MNGENNVKRREIEHSPYKGAESYQVEDRAFFFGRERESTEILSLILGARLSLLHAPSAAGKTSILNAQVMPALESRGSCAIRIRPGNNPILAVRQAVLDDLLPPPEVESWAVDEVLIASESSTALTLAQSVDWYDQLDDTDPKKRDLIAAVEWDARVEGHHQSLTTIAHAKSATPYIARLLRGTRDIKDFLNHLIAVSAYDREAFETASGLNSESLLTDLLVLLKSKGFSKSQRHWIEILDIPTVGFADFIANLVKHWGPFNPRFNLVLIFDQFEELFTRFTDSGNELKPHVVELQDWRLKHQFFKELSLLLFRKQASRDARNSAEKGALNQNTLPVRAVLSMRDEFIAELGPIRKFAEDLDSHTLRLGFLKKQVAEAVIRNPARAYHYGYSDECFEQIMKDLLREERFVEPAHLQIVCTRLWESLGKRLANPNNKDLQGQNSRIEIGEFLELGGTSEILTGYFRDILDKFPHEDKRELIYMLEQLITPRGTRNIVGLHELTNAFLRNPDHRVKLLDSLVNNNIVRIEERMGEKFVEITHEFLIGPIRDSMQDLLVNDSEGASLSRALKKLESVLNPYVRFGSELQISETDFQTLNKSKTNLVWEMDGTELMYRAAIEYGSEREVIDTWVTRLAIIARTPTSAELTEAVQQAEQQEKHLDQLELRLLSERFEELQLSESELELLAASAIANSADNSNSLIEFWIRKLMDTER